MEKETKFKPLNGLKAAMAIRGISPTEFAKEMGTTNQTIYNWLNGKNSPDMDQLRMASGILKVTTDFILFPEEQI